MLKSGEMEDGRWEMGDGGGGGRIGEKAETLKTLKS
jgi:hypothetical protein